MLNDLWIFLDLETDGLDPHSNHILEVFAMAVDPFTLEEVGRYYTLVQNKRLVMDAKVAAMHAESGLWAELNAPNFKKISARDLDIDLSVWVHELTEKHGLKKKPSLAGNSVHFDLDFLKVWTPTTASLLHYRVINCSTHRDTLIAWGIWQEEPKTPKHRCVSDVFMSISIMQRVRLLLEPHIPKQGVDLCVS